MPPFDETPPGFRPESLELLDIAMTKLWLEQVAIGATQSGASPEVRNSVNTSIRLLKERGTRGAIQIQNPEASSSGERRGEVPHQVGGRELREGGEGKRTDAIGAT